MTFPKNVAEPHETKAYRDDVLCKQFDVTRSQLRATRIFILFIAKLNKEIGFVYFCANLIVSQKPASTIPYFT